MDDQHIIRDVKREATDVKTETLENEDEEDSIQVDTSSTGSTEAAVRTVVLQNIEIGDNSENIPIILNNFPGGNSDGNLQIDTIDSVGENVIHTYIIE